VISPTQTLQPNNKQHTQQTDIHCPGGIQTRGPSKRGAAHPRLRPRGHRDRPRAQEEENFSLEVSDMASVLQSTAMANLQKK